MKSLVLAAAIALAAPAAFAQVDSVQEAPIQEATATAQPADGAGQAIAEWGRRVMAGESTADLDAPAAPSPAKDGSRCLSVSDDGKPHGEVWGGIGTRGYREVGGVVTQPLGCHASLTVAVDHVEGAGPRRRR